MEKDVADSMRDLRIAVSSSSVSFDKSGSSNLSKVTISTLGMFIIDDICLPNGTEMHGIVGGGGTYVCAGARIWTKNVGMIVDMGYDWEEKLTQDLNALDVNIAYRHDGNRKTTRACNYYGPDEIRNFGYSTDRKRIEPFDLHKIGWLEHLRVLHFVCSPERANIILDQLHECLGEEKLKDLWMVWEPIPDSCVPTNWEECKKVMKRVKVISPNHVEAAGFLDITKDSLKEDIMTHLLDTYVQHIHVDGVVVIRCAHMGVYVATKSIRKRIPSYYEIVGGITSQKIVDVTGGGNSFLGGYMAGLLETNGDFIKSAYYGNVSASFIIEQYGLPTRQDERWNDDDPKIRLADLEARTQANKSERNDTENIVELRSLLGSRFRISISDGRTFIGSFSCIDKGKNIILIGADEYRETEKRFVGMIMIPGKHIMKIELLQVNFV